MQFELPYEAWRIGGGLIARFRSREDAERVLAGYRGGFVIRRRMGYPWEVWRTAFHGGGLISRHRSREAAERAAKRHRHAGCECGCAVVLHVAAGERPASAERRHWGLCRPWEAAEA